MLQTPKARSQMNAHIKTNHPNVLEKMIDLQSKQCATAKSNEINDKDLNISNSQTIKNKNDIKKKSQICMKLQKEDNL